jgi:Post-segregation antitoxin CcdA
MGFGSFFKKKKKDVEKGVNDVENMIKNEIQPENELEKMDQSFTADKAEPLNANKVSSETNQLQAGEDIPLESGRSTMPDTAVSRSTVNEVTVNIDSELLRKAQAKGIDLSNTLEQQLRRMVASA